MININERIISLRLERNWSEYQLSEYAGITQSTISSWTRQNVIPSITNLEKICDAFGITLSQFFMEDGAQPVCLTEQQKTMFDTWNRLAPDQQTTLLQFLNTIQGSHKD